MTNIKFKKHKLVLVALSFLLLLAPFSSVFANDIADPQGVESNVSLKGGNISFKVLLKDNDTDIKFGELELEELSEVGVIEAESNLKGIVIDDPRGTGEGYTLQISASQFVTKPDVEGKVNKLDTGILFIDAPYKIDSTKNKSTNDVIINEGIQGQSIDGTTINLLVAEKNTGLGKNEFEFHKDSLKLKIKQKDARLGDYQSVITFTLIPYLGNI